MSRFHYDRAALAAALRAVGVTEGRVVFCHSNVGWLGVPAGGMAAENVLGVVLGAFRDVLGPSGTLVVPTFTWSFPRLEVFDPDETPSQCGAFTEMIRRLPEAVRSEDPCYSVAAIGARAAELAAAPENSFGSNSFFDRFLRADGLICNINFDAGSTFVHYVERCLRVPYRFDKAFSGTFRRNGREERRRSVISVMDLTRPEMTAAFEAFDRLARQRGLAKAAPVGRGAVLAITAADTACLIEETLPVRPWFLTKAEALGQRPDPLPHVLPAVHPHVDGPLTAPALPDPAGPDAAVAASLRAALDPLLRQGVGPGVEQALQVLGQVVPLAVHHRATGSPIGAGLVPERWVLEEARLALSDGTVLLDHQREPCLVPAHSRGFSGEVDRETLLRHVSVDPGRPDHAPAVTLVDENRWGLALPANWLDRLTADRYSVLIRVRQSFGALAQGEASVPGQGGGPVLVAADLGAEDAREAVLAALLFRRLRAGPPPRRSWHLLLYPRPFAVPVAATVLASAPLSLGDVLGEEASSWEGGDADLLERLWGAVKRLDAIPG